MFDPEERINYAEKLMLVGPLTDLELRSAAHHAYYGVFNLAFKRALDIGISSDDLNNSDPHRRLWAELHKRRSSFRTTWDHAKEMKRVRIHADYNIDEPMIEAEVKNVISLAKIVVKRIKSLK